MRYKFLMILSLSGLCLRSTAQEIKYIEYDLDNGLHVILHQDKRAPVVAVSVMYHVGSKDEDPQRTGFAHFFEHLLFEGSDNMKRGDFMKIVSSNGGQNNANTSQDRTFYYEIFPSNQLELGLWLESERMLHPKIDNVGVKTQNEVVKEEKRLRIDNKPYGKFAENIFTHLFEGHPYSWQPIGSMAHLDAAKLDEFIAFFKKYYVPNNAVLTIAGDLNIEKTKDLVAKYFNEVPKGMPVVKGSFELKPIARQIVDTVYDANIQIPAIFAAYRVPGMKSRDNKVLEMVSTILSGGGSSRLSTKMVDEKKTALQVAAFNYTLEDYGAYITLALPNNNTSLNDLLIDIDAEVVRLQTDLISESEFKKLQNQFENGYVSANTTMIGVAENLSNGYTFHNKNTNDLNEQLAQIKSITREEIRDVAKKYLSKDQRIVLYYLPKK
ncbi:insulinase family protein [Pedobacter panaciterrae]|uniref:M16 family metallopeptidase n=1 Tax=Pedobacter panaciterrae TaxID=363849 RepID=UPI00155DA4AE|nr:pitrilysin family protein [Pedobacter panaciterrae]NQX53632.1 insulinase family protein [Pedobacter panaciterrae]